MRLLVMNGDTVANVIEVDPDNILEPFADFPEAPEGVGVGMVWDGQGYAPPPAPPVTPDAVKRYAAQLMRSFVSDYTDEERETWGEQVNEAKAVTEDPDAPAPLLSRLAAADGVSVSVFAGYVLQNRAAFIAASGAVLAKQRELIAQDPIPQDYAEQLAAALT